MTNPHTLKAANFLGHVGAGSEGGGVRDLLGKLLPSTGVEKDTFELRAGPFIARQLRVVSWEGTESISDTFRVDCTIVAPYGPELVVPALMGQSACFTMQVPDGPAREMQGILASVVALGARAADDLYLYRVRLVPRLWLLKRTRASRIFQNRTVQSIVSAVLGKHGVPCRWALSRALPVREYCVQYEESDYEFVRRLLSEEGIYFYFEHPKGLAGELSALAHTAIDAGAIVGLLQASDHNFSSAFEELGLTEMVVFADGVDFVPLGHAISETNPGIQMLTRGGTVTAARRVVPTLTFRDAEGMVVQEEHVSRFERGRTLGPKACAVREFSPAKPRQTSTERWDHGRGDPKKATKSQVASLAVDLSRGHVPFPEIPALGMDPVTYEYGDHEGTAYFEPTALRARRLLEAVRRKTSFASGASNSRRISAGVHFELADHSVSSLNADYVVTKVRHVGVTPEVMNTASPVDVYTNKFECLPASHVPRPKRRPRARRQVAETALVVGPVDQEIHTDREGRIKVQFHWDRQGKMNESSSCWLRLSQAWAGPGFGVQFIPRVGMEVVVTFLHGDVDRPVVTGCVSNAVNLPPFALPDAAMQSGIRTRSSAQSGGYNELSFDDTAKEELVYLRAERTLEHRIGERHRVSIGHKSDANPGAEGYQEVLVSTDRTLRVGRHERVEIGGSSRREIVGDAYQSCLHETRVVSRDLRETVQGSRTVRVEGARFDQAMGGLTSTVYGGRYETTLGDVRLEVSRDRHATLGGSDTASVTGAFHVNALQHVTLESLAGVRLVCGASILEVTPDSIVLRSPNVSVRADERLALESPSASVVGDAEGLLRLDAQDLTAYVTEEANVYAKHTGVQATGISTTTADKIMLEGKSSILRLDQNALLAGTQVDLNPPGYGDYQPIEECATPSELLTSFIDIALVDDGDVPIGGARFAVEMANGDVVRGTLNPEGFARVPIVPGAAKVCFVDFDGASWDEA
jgi:type VI secretion system secreted protein VgrG